jgi:anti-sigma regulatory factor (Ser/Thr protein kinase)
MTSNQLKLVLPARAENVLVVRQAVAGLGEALGLSPGRIADLKTVVTEAANNVVLHAYESEPGPLEVTATPGEERVEIVIRDFGRGFEPRPDPSGEASLGLGLPLIASLSDSFEISGGAGEGIRTTVRFAYDEAKPDATSAAAGSAENGTSPPERMSEELEMAITPGAMVKPVLARVIGALAARAEFSVDRLSDTVLLGDAVSSSREGDLHEGVLGVSLKDGDGTLDVRVGPLVEGAGERLMADMDLPGHGSLRSLARSMEVTKGETADGRAAEFLVFEVAS